MTCSVTWGNCSKTLLLRILRLQSQKRAARIILNADFSTPSMAFRCGQKYELKYPIRSRIFWDRSREYDIRSPKYDNRSPKYDDRSPKYDNRSREYDIRSREYDIRSRLFFIEVERK